LVYPGNDRFCRSASGQRLRRDQCFKRRLESIRADPVGPGYQVPLARAVKQATTLPVIAVGLITEFEQAESILSTGDADLIALARAMLYNPRWPWHAAAHFGAQVRAPKQYLRSQPSGLRNLFF
jgi:2,4-dienoyl-CoA reductase-like NADH-dependent reductase (Old Yellow Enzyme family)